MPLLEARGVSVIHPDLATSGGILETKKIGDLAQEHGVAMAMHMAGSPIAALASVHCAAATENFLVLENHSSDVPWWDDLVTGLPRPLVQDGHIAVPETPGPGLRRDQRRAASGASRSVGADLLRHADRPLGQRAVVGSAVELRTFTTETPGTKNTRTGRTLCPLRRSSLCGECVADESKS